MLPLFDRNTRLPVFLQDALDRGAVILTANLRAARALQAAHAEDQRSLDAGAWLTPRILDWSSWVAALWDEYACQAPHAQAQSATDPPLPLTSMQEHQLWKQVQGADRDRVVAPERMAELAQEAYSLLGSYAGHPLRRAAAASPFGAPHEDAQRFLAWAASFDRLCEQHGWLSRTRLEEQLAAGVLLLERPAELVLVGFDRTTPAQAKLLAVLEQRGTRITRYTPALAGQRPDLLAASSPRDELEACARWCRNLLEQDGTRRIGVIAPDVGRHRAEIDRLFRRILLPQTLVWPANTPGPTPTPDAAFPNPSDSSAQPAPSAPYEFSLGTPLASAASITAALLILRWLQAPLPASELTWLLTSGFLAASAGDQRALARLDAELRRSDLSGPQTPLARLLVRANHNRHLPSDLRTRLERMQARAAREGLIERPGPVEPAGPIETAHPSPHERDRRRTYSAWAELVPALLAEAGWPGFRPTDSFAWQAHQRWTRLLGEIAQLGFDGSLPTWNEFLRQLDTYAHSILFAAESTAAPIQILGAFESSGQTFDALWFLGADDQHWPAVGRPHPLLPAWLQRETAMPHASPDADWLLAQQASGRILASAPVVVLSYPLQEQGIALRPSPLLPRHTNPLLQPAPASFRLQPVPLESIADHSGLLPWPPEQSAGGAEILKRQAACAFQSFATRRLQARPLEQSEQGLDAAERGTLLHSVLERLWSSEPGDPLRLSSRDDLLSAFANGSVTAMVTHHIAAAFAARYGEPAGADPWQQAYHACERERIRERLLDWLTCERDRQPFRIDAIERALDHISVGDLRLSLRPDRIDMLANGSRLLVDYKTGKVTTSSWDGERPEEPQLPLYALFSNLENVSGVAFAQIRADGTRLLARAEDVASQVSATLGPVSARNSFDDEVRDTWRESLRNLGQHFLQGDARVNPRNGARTCKWCPLSGLCRVHASPYAFASGDLEDEGGSEYA